MGGLTEMVDEERESGSAFTHDSFLKVANHIYEASAIEELMDGFIKSIGNISLSYHHFPNIGAFDYKNLSRYHAHNIPRYIRDYFDTILQTKPDPGILAVFSRGQYMWLSDLLKHPYVIKSGQDEYAEPLLENPGDGLCMPLYGPNNRKGYMFIACGKAREDVANETPYQIQALAQMLHVRYCMITEKLQKHVDLTKREGEVLELLSFGKSNPEIAKILGISSNTVAGYVKQIYLKLGTNDRVSAALRAQCIQLPL